MAYDPQTWVDYDPETPLTADRLLHMEHGVDAAHDLAEAAQATAEAPTAWADVTGKPTAFPPETHNHDGEYVTPSDPRLTDTGWRDISSMLTNGWTGIVQVRRVGPLVHFRARSLNGVAATHANIVTLPAGFRPGENRPAQGVGNKTSNGAPGNDPIAASGGTLNQVVRSAGPTADWTGGSGGFEFFTDDAMPNPYPGTPA